MANMYVTSLELGAPAAQAECANSPWNPRSIATSPPLTFYSNQLRELGVKLDACMAPER